MYGAVYAVAVARTVKAGGDRIDADRKADDHTGDQRDQRAVRADGGKGNIALKLSDDNAVGGIVQKLKHVGQHDGKRKGDDL